MLAAGATHANSGSEKWGYFCSLQYYEGAGSRRGDLPAGMVRVQGMDDVPGIGRIGDFFMDSFEVTNRQFKEFRRPERVPKRRILEAELFIKEGKVVSREEALKEFVDQTGRLGPAGWQAGDYPEGQGDSPGLRHQLVRSRRLCRLGGQEPACRLVPFASLGASPAASILRRRKWVEFSIFTRPLEQFFKGRGPARVGSFAGMTDFSATMTWRATCANGAGTRPHRAGSSAAAPGTTPPTCSPT